MSCPRCRRARVRALRRHWAKRQRTLPRRLTLQLAARALRRVLHEAEGTRWHFAGRGFRRWPQPHARRVPNRRAMQHRAGVVW